MIRDSRVAPGTLRLAVGRTRRAREFRIHERDGATNQEHMDQNALNHSVKFKGAAKVLRVEWQHNQIHYQPSSNPITESAHEPMFDQECKPAARLAFGGVIENTRLKMFF